MIEFVTVSVGGRFFRQRPVSGSAEVDNHSAKNQRKFNGFQEVLSTDDGQGRQFVSQLGALAEGAEPQSKVLSDRNPKFSWVSIKFLILVSLIPCLSRYYVKL